MRLSDIRVIASSPSKFWRNVKLLRNFDAKWYLTAYPDVAARGHSPLTHFIRYGIEEGRKPSASFDIAKLQEAETLTSPEFLDVSGHDVRYLERLRESDDLIVFFNVATTTAISGGMLSIDRFVSLALELTSDLSRAAVAVCGVPLHRRPVTYMLFRPCLPMTHFYYIINNTWPARVRLFVPEVFVEAFVSMVLSNDRYRRWLKERPQLGIVILNQNVQLMPAPQPLVSELTKLTMDVIISTAHSRYCTKRLAAEYGLAVKQLTPLLPKMPHRLLVERKAVFMISPDALDDKQSGLTDVCVIERLKAAFPHLEFIVINNMKLGTYLDLASRVMFSLTFGEGMDGYFIEPVLSGGVSFAVYNDVFFPPEFAGAPTVAKDWSQLLTLIEEMVPRLQAEPGLYDRTSRDLQYRLAVSYSYEISKRDLSGLLEGHIDHLPTAKVDRSILFDNIRLFLESERNFRFHNGLAGDKKVVLTPDGLIVQHLGGEFYSVLYEIYERRDYDMALDGNTEYVLIDIGANVGMASLYLRNKYANIKEVYAYEPLRPVALIAEQNFVANVAATPFISSRSR